mgnify:CR=1 FL=1
MNEANVANTLTILGRTNVVPVFTHWKTVAENNPATRAAVKINSLFIANRSTNTLELDLRIARDPNFVPGAVYTGSNQYAWLMNRWLLPRQTTVVAISRDNPVWLQPGDFLQILASLNYCCEAVCSYEFVSDQAQAPEDFFTPAGPVLDLNAAPIVNSGDGSFGRTNGGGVELTWSPPLSTGGAAITNYLVQWRAKMIYATSPQTEGFTGWALLERPVSDIPNITFPTSVLLAWPRTLDWITTDYTPITMNFTSYNAGLSSGGVALAPQNVVGFQFRVAAYTPVGIGEWSAPSALIRMDSIGTVGDIGTTRVGVVEAVSLEALPNGVTLNWSGKEARLNPKTGEQLVIKDYRIRWSDDNGVTWLPSAAGVRLYNPVSPPPSTAEVRNLINGVDYVFSLQTICERTIGNITDELVGPWSLPTRNVMPPGLSTTSQAQAALKAMFVRWI